MVTSSRLPIDPPTAKIQQLKSNQSAGRMKEFRRIIEGFCNDFDLNTFGKTVEDYAKKLYSRLTRQQIKAIVILFLGLWLAFGCAADLVCNLIGFGYPAYKSVLALESPQKEDDTQWLIYWVVYATFLLTEGVTDFLFSFIPLYYFLKCFFLVWCMAPFKYNGSQFIYWNLIRPFIMQHQQQIDKTLQSISEKTVNALQEAQLQVSPRKNITIDSDGSRVRVNYRARNNSTSSATQTDDEQ